MTRITYRIAYQADGKRSDEQSTQPLRFDLDYLTLRQALDRALALNAGVSKVSFIQKVIGELKAEILNGAALADALEKRRYSSSHSG